MAHEDRFGPVDYVVVEFSDGAAVRPGLEKLLRYVDAGILRVLDLEFVTSSEGVTKVIPAEQVSGDLAQFAGASSGLLDRDDLDIVAAELAPGATAAVLVFEDLSILDVIDSWERAGARVTAEGPVDVDDIDAALQGD